MANVDLSHFKSKKNKNKIQKQDIMLLTRDQS
jgi:hypothetical protein